MAWRVKAAVAACLLLMAGCDGGPRLHSVHGNVTYRGEPVAQGQIVFADADGDGLSASAPVVGGRYQIRATAGLKQIRITASRETGRMLEGAMGAEYPDREDLIPPEYNTATTLTRTVEPHDAQVLDFALP